MKKHLWYILKHSKFSRKFCSFYIYKGLKFSTKTYVLWYILLFSLVLRLIYLLADYSLWWDTHVYIGMGKYIFTMGKLGVWESFRPLVHPIILGALWKLNLNIVFVGKILDIIFSLCAVYLTYLVTLKIFNRKTAIASSIVLSITPLFLMFTGLILTEPLAITFGLLGIYYFIKEKRKNILLNYFFSGIFLSLSFLTKFPQGIFFAIIFLILLFRKERFVNKIKNVVTLSFGFIILIIPYMWFNYLRYPNMLEPFVSGSWIVTTATWLYGEGLTFYLTDFFFLNPFYLFFFGYIYLYFKEKQFQSEGRKTIFWISVLTIIYFLYVPRKEPRYLVTILPMLAIMASYTALRAYHYLKKKEKPFIKPKAFFVICIIALLIIIPGRISFAQKANMSPDILEAIQTNNITGTILTTDPLLVSITDNNIVLFSGMEFAQKIYEENERKYEFVYINTCDLICAPDDGVCLGEKDKLLAQIDLENKKIFNEKFEECDYLMYVPIKK